MKQTLGIYVGTESIGWSLVRYSTNPRIVAMGTRVFSSFLNYLGEGERETSNATLRTQVRNVRKLQMRKNFRKQNTLSFLASNKLCPLTLKELSKWSKDNKHKTLSIKMNQWMALNPYELRAIGIHEKLSRLELGRVLYHFAQRRGKIMNGIDSTNANILLNGLPLANRRGINDTKHFLKNQYLGEYLNSLLPTHCAPYSYNEARIRNRYLSRSMYLNELDAILKQQQHHHEFLDKDFRKSLLGKESNKGILYSQRPAQYRKQGNSATSCEFEKGKKTMWQSHPLNEWFNIYCWVDSIKLYGEPLNHHQRKQAIKIATHFSSFLFKKSKSRIRNRRF